MSGIDFQRLAHDLQISLGFADSPLDTSSLPFDGPASVVVRLRQLKLKMYQEKGHQLPHLHVDYGTHHHSAAFSIPENRCIAGNLGKRHERSVQRWIGEHRDKLLDLWQDLQNGGTGEYIIASLAEDEA